MPAQSSIPLRLDGPPQHLDVQPGGEIILRGSFHSKFDGTTVDAATTTWPAEAPGGASVDPSGLIDFEAGGLHLTSRDAVHHEVHAIVTGKGGETCALMGTTAPCLPLRLDKLALERRPVGIPRAEFARSLQGGINIEGLPPPVIPVEAPPYLAVAAGVLALGLAGFFARRTMQKRAASPAGQLVTLARRVQQKLAAADAVMAAPLAPAVATAMKALKAQRIDPSSAQGKRVAAVLVRVEARLDASVHEARSAAEQEAADELVREVESALEAAEELRS
jgi:hypothetical protein